MARPSAQVKIPSRSMRKGVQSTLKLADKAVATGKIAVAASVKAARKNPTAQTINAVAKNSRTLAKAESIRDRLRESNRLANDLCPLNVLVLVFEYV